MSGDDEWRRTMVTAHECPRITQEFLDRELKLVGQRWFGQEYECIFYDAIDAYFLESDIAAAESEELVPLWG